jgi:type IV secretion system protein VirD4
MSWFWRTEREKWASPYALRPPRPGLGVSAFDPESRALHEHVLPRGVLAPRFMADQPPVNYWMTPHELAGYGYLPGQIILGKLAGKFLGFLDDRPMVTIAGARAGKSSTVLEPNLYSYPGSMLVLDPKAELAQSATLRAALGHNVHILDPFGQSGLQGSCFNPLVDLDPGSPTVADDVASITHALIVDDGDGRSKHWNDSARALLKGVILLTLLLPPQERHLVTARELLLLSYAPLVNALNGRVRAAENGKADETFYDRNRLGVEALLTTMTQSAEFGGILAGIGNRFLATPHTERGSVFSTASAQTDFIDSLPLRRMMTRSDLSLAWLRGSHPMTIYLCLPVSRMESHYRWLRLIVQMACNVLEQMGPYPRDRAPILFLMEEFATLGHMEIMERAAAYFPGFGVKLWAVLQDTTQLRRYYSNSWETFLGNAGLVQCFANGDQATLNYLSSRLETLLAPFELRTVFARDRFSQLLMFEGRRPAAAMRLGHQDVEGIRRLVEEIVTGRQT